MTTITLDSPSTTGRLEDLVDRLLATLFSPDSEPTEPPPTPSLIKAVHEGRRLRQSGDLDGALAVFAEVDTASATETQVRWLYAEWLDISRRRFDGDNAVLYSPGTGRSAVLLPQDEDGATLEVAAVLGMRWPVGKLVSHRSLRGLKPLARKAVRHGRSQRHGGHCGTQGPAPLGRRGGGRRCRSQVARAGSGRASAPSTRKPRAASRSTPTLKSFTASAAAPVAMCWTSCSVWKA